VKEFDKTIKTWQGWQAGNQTFGEEVSKVDIAEIRKLLDGEGKPIDE
jgi:hypothetical protein